MKNILSKQAAAALLSSLAIVFSAAWTIYIALCYLQFPPFTADSWSYFELSKSVFSDFYHFNTQRQYHTPGEYSTSFPPAWPVLIALFNRVFDSGVYAGYIMNVLISLGLLALLCFFSNKVFKTRLYGAVLFLALVFNRFYLDEVLSGRSIPLTVLLLFSLLRVYFTSSKPVLKTSVLMGAIAGLATLTRFDTLLACIIFGAASGLTVEAGKRIRFAAAYLTMFFLTISPWIIYSFTKFGKFFVSDNSHTVLSSVKTHVIYYHPEPLPTLFDQPSEWLLKTLSNIGLVLNSMFELLSEDFFLFALILTSIISAFLAFRARAGRTDRSGRPSVKMSVTGALRSIIRDNNEPKTGKPEIPLSPAKLLAGVVPFVIIILSVGLTGYEDKRYFVSSQLYFYLALLWITVTVFSAAGYENLIRLILTVFMAVYFAVSVLPANRGLTPSFSLNSGYINYPLYDKIAREIDSSGNARFLVVGMEYLDPFMFGALTGTRTFADPLNLTGMSLLNIIDEYKINRIATSSPTIMRLLDLRYVLKRSNHQYVYYIEGKK